MTDEERDLLIALSEWAVGTGVCETLSPKGKAVREKMDKLRNVAPPKPEPVLHERWVTVWGDGTIFGPFKSRPVEEFSGSKTIYIPWMSDGSPVEEDPVRYGVCETCVEKAVKSADEWRTKAEALQVEVDRLRTDRNACLDQINALNDDIEDMRPAVDAAVAYVNADGSAKCHAAYVAFCEAVRAYEAKQADPVVESCRECKWVGLPTRSEPCWSCRSFTKWESCHDHR